MKKYENLIANKKTSLLEAMQLIDQNSFGMLFIVEKERLIGCLSDGDIRRHLLKTKNLFSTIQSVMNTTPISIPIELPKEKWGRYVLDINPEIRAKLYPAIDSDNKIVEYFEPVFEFRAPISSPSLDGNELDYVIECIQTNWISSQGKFISRFETSFAEFIKSPYCLTTSNGTTALHLALAALNIKPGDEVIVPSLTFAATINAVLHCGATPVIVDVEKRSWCIDPAKIREVINKNTKAIIPVHLYGQSCDMDAIMNIAHEHKLYVVEDCAEAIGAKYKDKFVGTIGDVGCFSFFGNKVITTGEGGMCTTNNHELSQKMKKLRDHGIDRQNKRMYFHDEIGYNYRMTNMQAAIGVAQLERIESIIQRRNQIETNYRDQLSKVSVLRSQENIENCHKVCWLVSYVSADQKAETYIKRLKNYNIDARPFFYPLDKMDIYKKYSPKPCPVSEFLSEYGINFPTYTSLTDSEINEICLAINKVAEYV